MRYKVNKDGANKRVQTEGDPQVVSVGGNYAHSPWRSALVDVSDFIYARKGLALLFTRTSQLLPLAHPGNSPAGSTREAQTSHCPGCQQWPMNLLQSRGPLTTGVSAGTALLPPQEQASFVKTHRQVRYSLLLEGYQSCWKHTHTPTLNPPPKASR